MANELIAPERHGFFIVVAFILATVALLLSLLGIYRTHAVAVGTQIEVLQLNKKITRLQAGGGAAAPAARHTTDE